MRAFPLAVSVAVVGINFCTCDHIDIPNDLISFDLYCDDVSKSRDIHCVNAMQKYCDSKDTMRRVGGIAQEVGNDVLGVACFEVVDDLYTVWLSTLAEYDPPSIACNDPNHDGARYCDKQEKLMTQTCVSAISSWCKDQGLGNVGMAQRVFDHEEPIGTWKDWLYSEDTLQVACLQSEIYSVRTSELKELHPICNNAFLSQASECVAATHRWCKANGHGNVGYVFGVNRFGRFGVDTNEYDTLEVGCFDSSWYGDVFIKRGRMRTHAPTPTRFFPTHKLPAKDFSTVPDPTNQLDISFPGNKRPTFKPPTHTNVGGVAGRVGAEGGVNPKFASSAARATGYVMLAVGVCSIIGCCCRKLCRWAWSHDELKEGTNEDTNERA